MHNEFLRFAAAIPRQLFNRPVNLTLNEDLVRQAKVMTNNLSGVVDRLLVEFVSKERRERLARSEAIEQTVALWNQFNADQFKAKESAFSDDYSTL